MMQLQARAVGLLGVLGHVPEVLNMVGQEFLEVPQARTLNRKRPSQTWTSTPQGRSEYQPPILLTNP